MGWGLGSGVVPEAHGAHGAPSASGPEIYPHGGVLEAHRPRALKYTPTGGSSRPIGQGPSAKAHRPRPMEPMGPHRGMYFWILYFWRKVGPLGDSIRRLPGPLGGLGRTFVQ